MINVSIVLYNNNEKEIDKLIKNISESSIVKKIFVIDNSIKKTELNDNKKLIYIFNNKNIGYGKAHNIGLRKSINDDNIKGHLIINPDVEISSNDLERLYNYLINNNDVGIIVPKVIYLNGKIQYLSKLLPDPFDLIFRRFFYYTNFAKKKINKYELRFTNYNKIMEIGVASGSCMLINVNALKKAGLFDERYFMYLEDYDLSRRIGKFYKIIFFPDVTIRHKYEMHSYKRFKMLIVHIISAIKYFNKWGWFFDKYRKTKNKQILKKLRWENE